MLPTLPVPLRPFDPKAASLKIASVAISSIERKSCAVGIIADGIDGAEVDDALKSTPD